MTVRKAASDYIDTKSSSHPRSVASSALLRELRALRVDFATGGIAKLTLLLQQQAGVGVASPSGCLLVWSC